MTLRAIGQGKETLQEELERLRESEEGFRELYERDHRDALRFRYLQDLPVVQAQAFFWNYGSRTERAKAIDKAMKS